MIEEVRVIKVDSDRIWVEASGCEECSQCEAGEGCRNSRLFSLFAPRRKSFPLSRSTNYQMDYQIGDKLSLSFSSQGLLIAATFAYLIPLILLLGLSLVGHFVFALSEPALILFLLASGSIIIIMMYRLRLADRWHKFLIPRIVKPLQ